MDPSSKFPSAFDTDDYIISQVLGQSYLMGGNCGVLIGSITGVAIFTMGGYAGGVTHSPIPGVGIFCTSGGVAGRPFGDFNATKI